MFANLSRPSITRPKPGDHLCCIYASEDEHRAIVTPFLRQGLEQGQKVIYVMDAHSAGTILGYLRDDGLDADGYLADRQLVILTRDDAYLRDGVFDPKKMIASLQASTDGALKAGYQALRVTGEMTWALRGLPGSERLIDYESRLNEFFPAHQCLALCQYDQRQFDSAVLLDVLSTHPVAMIGTEVYDNFYFMPSSEYFIPPSELLRRDRATAQLVRCFQHLAERKRHEVVLQRIHGEVAEQVQERTTELSQANAALQATARLQRNTDLYTRSLLEARLNPPVTVSLESTDMDQAREENGVDQLLRQIVELQVALASPHWARQIADAEHLVEKLRTERRSLEGQLNTLRRALKQLMEG